MDTLTAGTITVVFSSMIALMRPLKSLTNVNAQFQRGMAACQTLFAILDSEQEKDEGTRVIERAKGNLKFENVTFTYPGREVAALRNINLDIPEGKTVALVGRSGSGKSTIASLITRFYDVDDGQILLDGHDLREYKLSSLRDQVALVSHRTCICSTILSPTTSPMPVPKSTAASRLKRPRGWPTPWISSTRWTMVWIRSSAKMA